jgi:hypothetical protein
MKLLNLQFATVTSLPEALSHKVHFAERFNFIFGYILRVIHLRENVLNESHA